MNTKTTIQIDLSRCLSIEFEPPRAKKPLPELPNMGYGITPTDYQRVLTIRVDLDAIDGFDAAYRNLSVGDDE